MMMTMMIIILMMMTMMMIIILMLMMIIILMMMMMMIIILMMMMMIIILMMMMMMMIIMLLGPGLATGAAPETTRQFPSSGRWKRLTPRETRRHLLRHNVREPGCSTWDDLEWHWWLNHDGAVGWELALSITAHVSNDIKYKYHINSNHISLYVAVAYAK